MSALVTILLLMLVNSVAPAFASPGAQLTPVAEEGKDRCLEAW